MTCQRTRPWPTPLLTCALVVFAGACLDRELSPIVPCLIEKVDERFETGGVDKVDVLFVVDNSKSMADEQALLRAQFPRMIELLTSGRRADGRGFDPVTDLHLGVVSTDLGAPGVCTQVPGDGMLSIAPNPGADPALSCPETLGDGARFLRYREGDDAVALAADFQCAATLGIAGCGIEQQLEASLKALLPSSLPGQGPESLRSFVTPQGLDFGHGDGHNAGFLRGLELDAAGKPREDSILAVVVVTDEEDCSTSSLDLFAQPLDTSRIDLLCHDRAHLLTDTARYVAGLRALRPAHPERVIFAAIAGIPQGAGFDRAAVDLEDGEAVDAQFVDILSHPDMQEVEIEAPDRPGQYVMRPVCKGAVPARRIVETARGFGRNGVVQSICEDDFGPALDAIVDAIADRLPSVCLPRPLVANVEGLVPGCRVFWDLPATPEPGELRSCGERAYLRPAEDQPRSLDGRTRCEVAQVPVRDGGPMPGVGGWFYDDHSEEVRSRCGRIDRADGTPRNAQRVSFSEPPGTGVRVQLACAQETPGGVLQPDGAAARAPDVGTACADAEGFPDDGRCAGAPTDDASGLFCHPELNRCVLGCETELDCPGGFVCDDREATVSSAGGRSLCLSPTCGS